MTGDIGSSIFFPGSRRFGEFGSASNRNNIPLRMRPVPSTITPEPKIAPSVCVLDTRLPSRSPTEKCVVCGELYQSPSLAAARAGSIFARTRRGRATVDAVVTRELDRFEQRVEIVGIERAPSVEVVRLQKLERLQD